MRTLVSAFMLSFAVALVISLLSGCASQPEMQMKYLGAYPIDCANKIKHQKHLETLLTGNRENDAIVKRKMWALESQCENLQPRQLEVLK